MGAMVEDLRLAQEGFVAAPGINRPVAIYLLMSGVEVLYVGQSKNVYRRLAAHYATRESKKPKAEWRYGQQRGIEYTQRINFTHVMIRFCTLSELDDLEAKYIMRFRPKCNVIVRAPVPKMNVELGVLAGMAGLDLDTIDGPELKRRL